VTTQEYAQSPVDAEWVRKYSLSQVVSDQNEGGSSTNSLRLYLDTRIAGDGHGQVLNLVVEDIS
jgi:hypothetical protein